MSRYKTERRLKRYWREDGNPRLKGLFLAGLDHTDVSAREVGEAWIDTASDRERHLAANSSHKALQAPISQTYTPGKHDNLKSRPESNFARTLAREEFSGGSADSLNEDGEKFLKGEKGIDKDKYIKRALLNDAVTELDVLFREELETTFIQGAQPKKVFREAANVVNVNRRKGDIPRETDETYAQVHGHSDEITTGQEGQDTVAFTTNKIAQGFEISDALMAESEPAIFESLARRTGAAIENTINRICLVDLIDNVGQTFDADVGGTVDATATQAINGAITNVSTQDFPKPDNLVAHPEFEQAIFDDSNVVYANRGGSTEPLQDRQMGSIMGVTRWEVSDGAYNNATNTDTIGSTDHTFGYAADGERGAVAFAQDFFNLVIWQEFDMETQDYEDPIRDLQGQNVRTWADSVYGQSNAACEIQY